MPAKLRHIGCTPYNVLLLEVIVRLADLDKNYSAACLVEWCWIKWPDLFEYCILDYTVAVRSRVGSLVEARYLIII